MIFLIKMYCSFVALMASVACTLSVFIDRITTTTTTTTIWCRYQFIPGRITSNLIANGLPSLHINRNDNCCALSFYFIFLSSRWHCGWAWSMEQQQQRGIDNLWMSSNRILFHFTRVQSKISSFLIQFRLAGERYSLNRSQFQIKLTESVD